MTAPFQPHRKTPPTAVPWERATKNYDIYRSSTQVSELTRETARRGNATPPGGERTAARFAPRLPRSMPQPPPAPPRHGKSLTLSHKLETQEV
jgi:hypothetical protein